MSKERQALRGIGFDTAIRAWVSGSALLFIALVATGWDLPTAVADDPTPVVQNCSQNPDVSRDGADTSGRQDEQS
jgi:hypothetical protein